jgi:hypothetical protein
MNHKHFALLAIITLAFIVLSCDKDGNDKDDDQPQPHQTTITAFGKTATVTGDASISTADFNTAVKNLNDTLIDIESVIEQLGNNFKNGCINMMDRGITITAGNAVPASTDPTGVNGALTVGVNYLKAGNKDTIGEDIATLVNKNSFKNYDNPVTINHLEGKGLAFEGKVTIKSDDTYTQADWNTVVAKVVAALNRGYGDGSGGNSVAFGDVFKIDRDTEVIVLKSASHDVEVKSGEYNKLYLKESALDTVNVKDAVWVMTDGLGGTGGKCQA